jgi:hypothetical protein
VVFDVEKANVLAGLPYSEGYLFGIFTAFLVRGEINRWNYVSFHVRYVIIINLN